METPTIGGTLDQLIADHPNREFYDPDLETAINGGHFPDDPEWQRHAFTCGDETRLRYINIPGTNINVARDDTWPWPVQFIGRFGQSGYDVKRRCIHFLTMDIDADATHDDGITTAKMETVKDFLSEFPWLNVIASTGGRGLHARVKLDFPSCESVADYRRQCKQVDAYLDDNCEFDFAATVDKNRQLLWIWRAGE